MSILINFLIGFVAAFLGVVPPGLLNMSAAKISMKENRKAAVLFSIGVCVVVIIQTLIALLFARYLDRHPEIIDILQKVALGIFLTVTIYFFFIAKDTRLEIPENVNYSKTNRFFYGMLLSMLNLLPLPYWVYISITFAGFGWFEFTQSGMWAAVVGSGLGTLTILLLYVQFFKGKKRKSKLRVNMNYVIGLVTAVISVITLIKILREI